MALGAQVENRRGSGDLRHGLVQRDPSVEGGRTSDEAASTDHGGFDRLSCGQTYDQGDNTRVREVDLLDGVADIEENGPLDQFHRSEMRPQHSEVRCRQRS